MSFEGTPVGELPIGRYAVRAGWQPDNRKGCAQGRTEVDLIDGDEMGGAKVLHSEQVETNQITKNAARGHPVLAFERWDHSQHRTQKVTPADVAGGMRRTGRTAACPLGNTPKYADFAVSGAL